MIDSVRFDPVRPLLEVVSVRLNFAGREPVLVMVSAPFRVSPGFMLLRSKIAALFLAFVCRFCLVDGCLCR